MSYVRQCFPHSLNKVAAPVTCCSRCRQWCAEPESQKLVETEIGSNARHTKNLAGRKSDVQESQWLLKFTNTTGVGQFVQPTVRDSVFCHLLAGSGYKRHWSGDLCSTNAESTDADEHQLANVISVGAE